MAASRIDIFKRILETDPENGTVLFGLAKEYEKAGAHEALIDTLTRYLAHSDDQGNAYGMVARAYEKLGQRQNARAAYQRGIEAAQHHGHPGMAEEYRLTLSSEYED